MITLIKYSALSGGEKYNVNVLSLDGLSTDTKPIGIFIEYGSDGREVGRIGIPNGSLYTEIDTGDTYMYDTDNTTWHKVSIGGGGGGGTQGGIILVGETTTQLVDNATTNPITVDGQSYTAQPNDAVIYGNKEFLFDGTKWHEFGDLSGLSSKDIGSMTNYVKAQAGAAIAITDTLNEAIGKVEKRVDVNETNISSFQQQITKNEKDIKANYNGGKNVLEYNLESLKAINIDGVWDGNEYTFLGITYTINDDMTISLSGSVTTGDGMSAIFLKRDETVIEYEGLHGSGCPSGGGMDKYALIFNMGCIDSGEGVVIHEPQFIAILITEGTEPPSESFKPMICTVEDWEESSEYEPYRFSNCFLFDKINANAAHTTDSLNSLKEALVNKEPRIKAFITRVKPVSNISYFYPKIWNGLTIRFGGYIWTDGENIYYSDGNNHYILDKSTSTWSTKTWNGLAYFNGVNIWTDGENIYYSDGNNQYILDKSTSTWSTKTWNGFIPSSTQGIWTDGDNIYYSISSNQYILDKSTSTWTAKVWTGITSFNGEYIWTDNEHIYLSDVNNHYILDKSTSTWSTKTWNGLTNFKGYCIWTDNEHIYYSDNNEQYVLDISTSTWTAKTWNGVVLKEPISYMWTDGDHIYYSNSSSQYVLKKVGIR